MQFANMKLTRKDGMNSSSQNADNSIDIHLYKITKKMTGWTDDSGIYSVGGGYIYIVE